VAKSIRLLPAPPLFNSYNKSFAQVLRETSLK
jgi:hypothetical protein